MRLLPVCNKFTGNQRETPAILSFLFCKLMTQIPRPLASLFRSAYSGSVFRAPDKLQAERRRNVSDRNFIARLFSDFPCMNI